MAYKINKKGAKINALLDKMDSLEPKATRSSDGFMSASDKEKLEDLPSAQDLINILAEKQNVITDLPTIRRGAEAGASAYQKPGSGIPESDMSDEVKAKLAKAESALQEHQDLSGKQDVITDLPAIRSGAEAGASAYQKPGTGIPASDLSSEVQDMIENGGKTKSVSVNGGTPVTPDENGQVDLTVPSKTSDLENDADFATKQEAQQMVDDAKIDTVSVDYQEDGGAPDASASFEDGELAFSLKNMKMKFSDLTAADKAELKGDSVIVGEGDLPLANTLGSSNEKAITQKCVTDELQYSTKLKEYSTVSQASVYVAACPVTEGKTYKLVFTDVTSGAKFNLQTSDSKGTQIQPIFSGLVLSEGFTTRFTAAANATHFRTYRHSGDCTITLYEVRNKFETIEEEIEDVESGIDGKIAEAQKINSELLSYSTASASNPVTVACSITRGKTYKFVFTDVTSGAIVTFSTANGDTPVEAILVDGSLTEGKVVLFTPSVNATHLRAYKKPSASASCTITVFEQKSIPNAIDEIEGQLGNMGRYTFTESTLPCNYQASLYATFNVSLPASRQGSTVYGDYFFQAFRGSDFVYIGIWNLETKTSAGGVYLEDFAIANTHANCISFGSEKYDEGDLFPLLYVPSGYPDNTIGGSQVYVYRLVGTIGNLEAQLIQTITLNGFSWTEVICGDSGKLWITWVSTNNTIKFRCYNTPSIANATATINVTDTPSDEFVLPAQLFPNASGVQNLAQQAGCYNKGRIWMANGNPTGGSAGLLDGACIIVINVRSKCREAVIWLRDIDLMEGVTLAEVEGCFIWNNQLYFPTQAAQIQKINKIDLT